MSAKSSLPACTDVNGGENCTNKSNSTAYTYKKPGSYMMGATITYTDKNGKKVSKTLDPINVNPSLATSSTCFDTNNGEITGYRTKGQSTAQCPNNVVIPKDINGTLITSIGPMAFFMHRLTAVSIPSSVTSIGSAAFSMNHLTAITIPSSVSNIGSTAFSMNELRTVSIPSSVTSIQEGAFSSNKLTTVSIPSSVTSIGPSAFDSNNLTTVEIPASVNSLGQHSFCTGGTLRQLDSVHIDSNSKNSATRFNSNWQSIFCSNGITEAPLKPRAVS